LLSQAILLLLRAFGISTGLGSVAFETTIDERGERLIWLEEGFSTSSASRAGRAKVIPT
jgi:hypothetical protein